MDELCIPEFLQDIDKGYYLVDKAAVETEATMFWHANKGYRFPPSDLNEKGKLLTQKVVALAFGFSAGRMTVILKDPNKIGKLAGLPQRIPPKEELMIVAWITQKCHAKIPTTMLEVIYKGNQIIKIQNHFATDTRRGPLTDSWYYQFYKRHKDVLSKRRVEGLDISRQEGRSSARIIEYYSILRDMLFGQNFKQSKIFNLDETPCPINNIPRYSIWKKDIKDAHVSQPDNRMVLTMLACVAANGTALPPLIIFQGKTVDLSYMDDSFDCLVASDDTAYMTKDLFRSWVVKFVELSKPTSKFPVLLIMDNFGGHLDWDAFEYLHIIGLPPHSSDLTQPLDLSVFGPLKNIIVVIMQMYRETLQSKSYIKEISQI